MLKAPYRIPPATHSRGSASVGLGSKVRNAAPVPRDMSVPVYLPIRLASGASAVGLLVEGGVSVRKVGTRQGWRTGSMQRKRSMGSCHLERSSIIQGEL